MLTAEQIALSRKIAAEAFDEMAKQYQHADYGFSSSLRHAAERIRNPKPRIKRSEVFDAGALPNTIATDLAGCAEANRFKFFSQSMRRGANCVRDLKSNIVCTVADLIDDR